MLLTLEKTSFICYTILANGEIMAIENRSAHFNYFIEDSLEAGIELVGCEVKSIRTGNMSLLDSFIKITNGEIFLHNANIATYDKTSQFVPDPKRTRKLLLHKSQIEKLERKTKVSGYALVPLKVYFVKGLAKISIGLGKGKKLYNKKQTIKERDAMRQAQRDIKLSK